MATTPQARLKRIQQFISRMPSLSTTVTKVLEICNDPSSSPNDLNRVISLDPVLTGQVLKLINSAYYGLPNRITSLTRAIIMLGINTVKNLVLATAVLSCFKGTAALRGSPIDDFWEHSLTVGVTARMIAKLVQVPAIEREEYFVAGLLHDLGKLPIMGCFLVLYQEICNAIAKEGTSRVEVERRYLGFDHCHVNRLIAAKWKLSIDMDNALVFHHQPFEKDARQNFLLHCVSLANQISYGFKDESGAIGSSADEALFKSLVRQCQLSVTDLTAARPEIDEQLEKARVFLNISGKG
jgi:HD-like signal output (HDOD) protein